jgi:branched-chain amino acid aminotransferase
MAGIDSSSSTSVSVKKTDKIWLDGKFVPWNDANVHLMTHSLHYGLGVFEGIRAYKTADGRTAVFRLRDHIHRLFESAHILLLEIPFSEEQLVSTCVETLRINRMDLGYLRPIAFMGDGAMGLGAINPTRVAVSLWDWGAYLGEEGLRNGIRAKVSSFTRMHVNINMVRGKITGQYVNSILAKREVKLAGYDEAILLDAQGFVAEASGENIFMIKGGVVWTPPLSSPILAGVTRDTVMRLLRDKGYEIREATFTRDSLYIADEVFFTGTAAEVTPVREVDNRRIGAGTAGPITRIAQDQYFKVVRGEEPRYREWLTFVS